MDATANVTGAIIAATPLNWAGIIWLYIGAVALLAFVPRFVDMFLAYRHQRALMEKLIEKPAIKLLKSGLITRRKTMQPPQRIIKKEAENQILEKIKGLIPEITKQPEGMPGIARLTIAFTIIFIAGIVLFHLVVFGQVPVDVISPIITSLVAIVGTIAGFYFGGKASEGATKKPTTRSLINSRRSVSPY